MIRTIAISCDWDYPAASSLFSNLEYDDVMLARLGTINERTVDGFRQLPGRDNLPI